MRRKKAAAATTSDVNSLMDVMNVPLPIWQMINGTSSVSVFSVSLCWYTMECCGSISFGGDLYVLFIWKLWESCNNYAKHHYHGVSFTYPKQFSILAAIRFSSLTSISPGFFLGRKVWADVAHFALCIVQYALSNVTSSFVNSHKREMCNWLKK